MVWRGRLGEHLGLVGEQVSIWGHDFVHVEKDVENRRWIVSTSKMPRQHLVTVPWTDAFKHFAHAPDYSEAVTTCQSSRKTALTDDEEQSVLDEIANGTALQGEVPAASPAAPAATVTEPAPRERPKVLSLADYKKRRT